jgi:hypothetical protein
MSGSCATCCEVKQGRFALRQAQGRERSRTANRPYGLSIAFREVPLRHSVRSGRYADLMRFSDASHTATAFSKYE